MTMCGTLEYMSPEVMDCKHASRASGEANLERLHFTFFKRERQMVDEVEE